MRIRVLKNWVLGVEPNPEHPSVARFYHVRFTLRGDFVQLEIQYLVSEPF